MAKPKPDEKKQRVRTVSLPAEAYLRLQPIVEAVEAQGETEAFVIRQVARVAVQRRWTAAELHIPVEVKREGDGDRVTPRLSLPPAMDAKVIELAGYATVSRWYAHAVERFLDLHRSGDPDLFRVI